MHAINSLGQTLDMNSREKNNRSQAF